MHAGSKSSGNHERDMLENIAETSSDDDSQSTSFDNHNQSTSSNVNQENSQSSDDDSPKGEGVRSTLHGIIYQLKLSLLFLQTALDRKYKFKLYSEKKNAQKFDDVVFNYNKDGQLYRFLQAKHTLYPEKNNITIDKLCSEDPKEEFNLQKYFISFRRIQQEQEYKDKIKDFIICTNISFSKNIHQKGRLTKQEENDEILDIGEGERYKLNFDKNKDIIEKLKDASDLKQLAKKLAEVVFKKEKLELKNKLFKLYHIPLAEKVFKSTKDQNNKCYCTFKEDFIKNKNLSVEANFLREFFKKEIEKKNPNYWSTLSNKKPRFLTSQSFGKKTRTKKRGTKKGEQKKEKQKEIESKLNLPNDLITYNEIETFFEKLVFAVKQPNEKELGKLIQSRISSDLDNLENDIPAEFIYAHVQKEMLDWLKTAKSTALTNKNTFFEKGIEKIKKLMLLYNSSIYESNIKSLNINFNNTFENQKIGRFLKSNNKIFNLISSTENISLSQAKVYEIKKQLAWYLQELINLKQCKNIKARSLFQENLLIIVCKDESEIERENILNLHHELVHSIREDCKKKIILITKSNSTLAELCKLDFKNNYTEELCQIKVKDLDQAYLREQLMEKKITFQGQERSLEYLLDIEDEKIKELNNLSEKVLENLEKVFKSEALSEFILNKNIIVGNKLPNFTDKKSPYYDQYYIDIPRTFSHQIIENKNSNNGNLLQKCINERKEDLFVFCSTMTKDCLNKLVPEEKNAIRAFSDYDINKHFFEGRFFILDDISPETNFEILCNQYDKKYIHWLTSIDKNKNKFKVKYSNSLSSLQKFMKLEKLENLKEEIDSSRITIIGDPGVGKSTILTNFQTLDTHSWFIRINLRDHQEYIKTVNFNNVDKIKEFLCRSDLKGFESALSKSLLKYYLEYGNRVVLLLDGFDEIENNNQEKVIELLKSFPTNSKLWLTTRSNQQYKIEDALGNTFSCFLNPFTEKEQKEFLKEYCIKKRKAQLDKKEKDNINKFTEKLLEHFYLTTGENLVGIVLQARMVVEICLKYYEEFNNHDSFKFEINNIFDLYGEFIKHQYNRYFTKFKIDKISTYNSLQIILTKLFLNIHEYFAINALFSEEKLCKYLGSQIDGEFPKDILNGIGLITNFENKSFIHSTYAEYFVAKLLGNMLSKSKDHIEYKLVREFLLKNIFLNRNKLIRKFFKYEIKNIHYNKECDMRNKWEEIEKCDLLTDITKTETKEMKMLPFVDNDANVATWNNILKSNKTLNELIEDYIELNNLFEQDKVKSEDISKTDPFVINDENVEIQHNNASSNNILNWFENLTKMKIKDILSYFKNIFKNFTELCIKGFNFFTLFYVTFLLEEAFNKTFQNIFKMTDIKTLESELKNLLSKINKNSPPSSPEISNFLLHLSYEYLHVAIIYYLIQARLQRNCNTEFEKTIFKDIFKEPKLFIYHKRLNNFKELDKQLKKKIQTQECIKNIIKCLIPEDKHMVTELAMLNYQYYYVNKLNKHIVRDINSIKDLQKTCTDKIIDFLSSVEFYNFNYIKRINEIDLTHLQPFFMDIIYHSDIIAHTKCYINEIYQKHDHYDTKYTEHWLERQGILIFRVLKILTKEMAEIFNSVLNKINNDNDNNIVLQRYCSNILFELKYFVDKMETSPQVDKLAFLKMVVKFSNIKIDNDKSFPFNLNQVEKTLKLIENILKKRQSVFEVEESVEYLYILKKVGLHLINIANPKILVLDPEEKLRFELSSNYKNKIIKLLLRKYKNYNQLENKFIVKCREIVKKRKRGLKTNISANNSQGSNKRLKV